MSNLAKKKCIPCEGNVPRMTPPQSEALMGELNPEWMLIDQAHMLARSFNFKDFKQTMYFVNEIARVAEEENHHPEMTVSYNTLGVELYTHAIDGLSENDFILAAKIDQLKK